MEQEGIKRKRRKNKLREIQRGKRRKIPLLYLKSRCIPYRRSLKDRSDHGNGAEQIPDKRAGCDERGTLWQGDVSVETDEIDRGGIDRILGQRNGG